MNNLIDAFNDNLQIAYRKAVDADNNLDKLQKDGKGKFAAIFPDDSPFETSSKRFIPYVQEIASDVEQLQQLSEQEIKAALPETVKKLELLLATLVKFKTSV
ncbi:hypothetical protein [Glaciecola sp. 1036]|uniref:hypothetical protein n=1 Tax=Alteromonadaceae TaxID=72275 RepID=UPI003CFECBE0